MSGTLEERSRVAIMTDLQSLTNDMLNKRNDADALIIGIEQRQDLMDEFDSLPVDISEEDRQEIRRMAKDILQKDRIISSALGFFHNESKDKLASNKNQQRVLGYANNAISSSGSYMDYKK